MYYHYLNYRCRYWSVSASIMSCRICRLCTGTTGACRQDRPNYCTSERLRVAWVTMACTCTGCTIPRSMDPGPENGRIAQTPATRVSTGLWNGCARRATLVAHVAPRLAMRYPINGSRLLVHRHCLLLTADVLRPRIPLQKCIRAPSG